MNNHYEKPFYQSKKWWDMVLGIGVVVAVYALELPKEVLIALAPILGHQLSQGMADFGKENKARAEVVSTLEEEIDDQAETIEALGEFSSSLEFEVLRVAGDVVVSKEVYAPLAPIKTPEDWEKEYLAYFEERIKYYKGKLAMYPDKRFRFDELLSTAEHTLKEAKIRVASVKSGASEPDSLGPVGYYILGRTPPWEK